jgi:hypothetical protein
VGEYVLALVTAPYDIVCVLSCSRLFCLKDVDVAEKMHFINGSFDVSFMSVKKHRS